MNAEHNDIALIGLGTMGRNLVLNMADRGFSVAAFNRTTTVTQEFIAGLRPGQHVEPYYSLDALMRSLKPPRRVMMMVAAGKAVDAVLEELGPLLEPGDIVIDGGNSHFTDTDRRSAALEANAVRYLGTGISGGESGARLGPSMMPGGPREAYEAVKPIFETVAAHVAEEPCVTYLGPRSAGHYVKMVHNGIEYGIMQLIAESYALLKKGLGFDNDRLAQVYGDWQGGELESYLIEITAKIFQRRDESTGGYLVDLILGEAEQLGTGLWTSQSALDLHVPVPNIDIAVSMRNLSGLEEEREAAKGMTSGEGKGEVGAPAWGSSEMTVDSLRAALGAGIIITYAQGFAQLRRASAALGYDLDLSKVAAIWRGGCIIRSVLLQDIRAAFERRSDLANLLLDPHLSREVSSRRQALAEVCTAGIGSGIPVPGLLTALGYLDAYGAEWLPSNLIQAQRDFFGAHTYHRTDQEGVFHTDWLSDAE
jgi:6-phosphogluconate dehydrogenase